VNPEAVKIAQNPMQYQRELVLDDTAITVGSLAIPCLAMELLSHA
jgi:hypothetical protein